LTDDLLVLSAIGVVAGLFGGLLGIGGSVIILPGLAILFAGRHDVSYQHVYQAAAMILNFFVSSPAAWRHRQAGTVFPRLVAWLIPSALAGILLGVAVSNLPIFTAQRAIYLRKLLGCFLIYATVYNLLRLTQPPRPGNLSQADLPCSGGLRVVGLVGLPMGFIAGLLGIGGGSLAVPLQQVFLKMPLRNAIANSATVIVATSLAGAAFKNVTLPATAGVSAWAGIKLATALVPACLIGGYLGGHLTYKLSRNIVRIALAVVLGYAAAKLLL